MKPYLIPEVVAYATLLVCSFNQQTGQTLPDDSEKLWHHPYPLVSHGTEADPVFCYANCAALALWEMDWQSFTRLPSRISAEPDLDIQSNRAAFLRETLAKGHVIDYEGIRISAKGNRFSISQTTLWSVVDAKGKTHGQAALIGKVTPIG